MIQYAQTNLQLYNQLMQANYSASELGVIRKAYDLAIQLFANTFRANKKPFIAHLVGTASILAEAETGMDTIAAGLLHSVFSHGEFGDGSRGPNRKKRAHIKRVVGSTIEYHVMSYTEKKWTAKSIQEAQESFQLPPEKYRVSLTIRLADILEEFVDHGVRFSSKQKLTNSQVEFERTLRAAVTMAERLRLPVIAQEFRSVLAETTTSGPTDCLRSEFTKSFTVEAGNSKVALTGHPRRGVSTWLRRIVGSVRRR